MRWEYLFVEFNAVNNVSHVYRINEIPYTGDGKQTLMSVFSNQLGHDGWEMVNYSAQLPGNRGPDRSLIVFKRPMPQ